VIYFTGYNDCNVLIVLPIGNSWEDRWLFKSWEHPEYFYSIFVLGVLSTIGRKVPPMPGQKVIGRGGGVPKGAL